MTNLLYFLTESFRQQHFRVKWEGDDEEDDEEYYSIDDIYIMPNGRKALTEFPKAGIWLLEYAIAFPLLWTQFE